jgi:hypothetical protein
MPTIEDVLLHSLAQAGDAYVFGAAVDFADPDPREFDCSGLVQWSCDRAGVKPRLPHSSFLQARHCIANHTDTTVADGVATRGALLFKFTEGVDLMTIATRPETAHVAWSLGNGSTIEAASTKWGVGSFTSDAEKRKWTHAARLPGVDYAAPPPPIPTDPMVASKEDEEMAQVLFLSGAGAGEVHPYVISGVTGKHLSPDALELHQFFKTPTFGTPTEPLPAVWKEALALLDGPLRNITQ